jgi:hypothetical protein
LRDNPRHRSRLRLGIVRQRLWSALAGRDTYDHVTGGRFRHGTTLFRWRPDKAPCQCTMEQLVQEATPSRLIGDIL